MSAEQIDAVRRWAEPVVGFTENDAKMLLVVLGEDPARKILETQDAEWGRDPARFDAIVEQVPKPHGPHPPSFSVEYHERLFNVYPGLARIYERGVTDAHVHACGFYERALIDLLVRTGAAYNQEEATA